MLVLLSIALVVGATVLLILGLLSDDGLLLTYLSMAASVAAAIVLLVASRLNKSRREIPADAPAPLADAEPEPEREPALVGAAAGSPAPTAVAPVATAPEPPAEEAEGDEWLAKDQDDFAKPAPGEPDDDREWDGEVEFPIADYDTLTSAQILPLLPQLYVDEIDVVEARERATKGRPEILTRLAELRRTGTDVDPLPGAAGDAEGSDAAFPIADYESLSAAQIRPLLDELDEEELAQVRAKEMSLGRRQSLIDEIDARLAARRGSSTPAPSAPSSAGGSPDGPVVRAAEPADAPAPASPAPPATPEETSPAAPSTAAPAATTEAAPAPVATEAEAVPPAESAGPASTAEQATASTKASTKTTTKASTKAAAKKTAAKKTTAKKAAAKKAAAPAKKTAAKKAAAPAKKTAAKKAAAKKATATKAAAPAKKTAA
ncbi:MAG TPA: hypothetical protein VK007_00695 [Acidimicrobiales bacterium]|nr:hypothetical protein [Acidimicrobiales bacterium]